MQKFKSLIAALLTVSMIFGTSLCVSAASTSAKIVLDGKQFATGQAPKLEKNVLLVPVKNISEALGGVVVDNAKTVTINTANHSIKLTLNSKAAIVDGKSENMESPAKNYSGVTYVPLKFITQKLGADFSYNTSTKTATIKYFSNMTGSLKLTGSTTIQPIAEAAAKALMKMSSGLTVAVSGGGSGVGVKDAASGTANIGNSSAALSASEKAQYPDLVQTQIGSDAIAVIVNQKNPVKNLTKQQVFDIFTGKIKNWKEVGGNNAAIMVQVRESTSGTAKSFFDLAIKPIDKNATIPSSFTPAISSGTLMQAVNANVNAIGYDSYGYINPKVTKCIAIDDIQCTDNNVNALIWPYTRSLVMLTKNAPTGLSAKFINYIRSTEGQKILSGMDFILLRNQYAKKVTK